MLDYTSNVLTSIQVRFPSDVLKVVEKLPFDILSGLQLFLDLILEHKDLILVAMLNGRMMIEFLILLSLTKIGHLGLMS